MIRVKRGVTKHARHKKWIERASGYFGRSSTCYRIARLKVERGMRHAVMHRRKNASNMRSLWIMRINAAARANNVTYSQLMHALTVTNCTWNRKTLSECAISNPSAFAALVADTMNKTKAAATAQ